MSMAVDEWIFVLMLVGGTSLPPCTWTSQATLPRMILFYNCLNGIISFMMHGVKCIPHVWCKLHANSKCGQWEFQPWSTRKKRQHCWWMSPTALKRYKAHYWLLLCSFFWKLTWQVRQTGVFCWVHSKVLLSCNYCYWPQLFLRCGWTLFLNSYKNNLLQRMMLRAETTLLEAGEIFCRSVEPLNWYWGMDSQAPGGMRSQTHLRFGQSQKRYLAKMRLTIWRGKFVIARSLIFFSLCFLRRCSKQSSLWLHFCAHDIISKHVVLLRLGMSFCDA